MLCMKCIASLPVTVSIYVLKLINPSIKGFSSFVVASLEFICALRKPILLPSPPILNPFTPIPDQRAFLRIALVTAIHNRIKTHETFYTIFFVPIISALMS